MTPRDNLPGRAPDLREEVLAEVLSEYVDRLNAGECIQPETVRIEHPELAEELLVELKTIPAWIERGSPIGTETDLGTIGDYSVERELGRGGMGVVYKAWQNSMERPVALKILPTGVAADGRASARFLREAQAAGQLDHPNVVHVHGIGIEEKNPYYAMEFVEGETLAELLRDSTNEANTRFGKESVGKYFINVASAFADVADGLHHAHSRGVIHRDIKPSNLILDGSGRFRILDFGLAHVEGQDTLTRSGEFLGTPLYMSPEQAHGKRIPIDHRTDIYSLGATLYEAICGAPPFRGTDAVDTLSKIVDRDPVEPQTVNPRVPKDLETIVLKCLRKDAGARYSTAEALSQDLRRFVRGDPIEARPRSAWEILVSRGRRHRRILAVSTCVLAAATLSLTIAVVEIGAARDAAQAALDRAIEESRRSRENARLATDAMRHLVEHLADTELEDSPRTTALRLRLWESTVQYHRDLFATNPEDVGVRLALARSIGRLAEAQQRAGEDDDAEASLRDATAGLESLTQQITDVGEIHREWSLTLQRLGTFLAQGGRRAEAVELARRALDVTSQFWEADPNDPARRFEVARCLGHLAMCLSPGLGTGQAQHSQLAEALEAQRQSVNGLRELAESEPKRDDYELILVRFLANLAQLELQAGEPQAAAKSLREAVRVGETVRKKRPQSTKLRSDLGRLYDTLGVLCQFDLDQPTEAEAAYRRAVDLRAGLARDFPSIPQYRSDVAASRNNLAMQYLSRDAVDEAERCLVAAIAEQESAIAASPEQPIYRQYLAQHHFHLARLYDRRDDSGRAETARRDYIAMQRQVVMDSPDDLDLLLDLAREQYRLARSLELRGELEGASAVYSERVELLTQASNTLSDRLDAREMHALAYVQWAVCLRQLDHVAEAEFAYSRAISIQAVLVTEAPDNGSLQNHYGDIVMEHAAFLDERGQLEKAEPVAQTAVQAFELAVQRRAGYRRYEDDLRRAYKYVSGILLRRGKVDESAAMSRRIPKVPGAPASAWFEAARLLAACATSNDEASTSEAARETLVAEVIRHLQTAQANGWSDQASITRDAAFVHLAQQDEFKRFLSGQSVSPAPGSTRKEKP